MNEKLIDRASRPRDLLLSNEFVVPTYQRSFAWTDNHVQNLLTDLSGAMTRRTAGRGDTYFLGAIVVIERVREKTLEVVDGQQRLATISIILAAIRDYHLAISKSKAAESYDAYLRSYHVPSGKHPPRLKLNEIDDRCFSQMIVEHPSKRPSNQRWPIASHKKILAAYACAAKFVESIASTQTTKNTIHHLYNMVEFIKKNTQVIRVTVDDDADAFTVFETLNDRHLYLTVADLLKNFLFGMSGSSIEATKGNWREMQGALGGIKGKDRTVDFIRQLWGSMHGLVREKELFRDIKAKITDESEAEEFSVLLQEQAQDYVAVLNPESELWDGYGTDATHALRTFNALRIERIRPLLLAILLRFDKKEVIKSLAFLRAAAVRILVTTGFTGSVEEQIFSIAFKVHHKEISKTSQLAKAMSVVPNDSVFEAVFATMNVSKESLSRFYLQEIQDAATSADRDTRSSNRNERVINLEHIIPTAASERATHWPELSPELGAALCRRLGNQTLITKADNSRLNGKAFTEKVKVYAGYGGMQLTSTIARDYVTFGEKEVIARQLKLAKLAVDAWSTQMK